MQSRIEIRSSTALLCYADFFSAADSLTAYQQLTDCGLVETPDTYSFSLLVLDQHEQLVTRFVHYTHQLIVTHLDILFESNFIS